MSKSSFSRSQFSRPTKTEKLLTVLSDGRWHTTRELVRRVGHTFAIAKFKLIACGYAIERRRHPAKRFQHQYRMVKPESLA